MEKPYLLHFATPGSRVSPFDVNMAYDAGWDAVIPYAGVGLDDMAGFTQDAIFSRGPKGARRTGIFIGGRDSLLALDMLEAARQAMVPPFQVSLFADPSGAFTTAAALVAKVEQVLGRVHGQALAGCNLTLLGGGGPVGMVAAVLAARAGARVTLAGHDGPERAGQTADLLNRRFTVSLSAADARPGAARQAVLADSEVILATARAGVQVVAAADLAQCGRLRLAADLNAVPPAGVEGLGVMDDGVALAAGSGHAVGVGPLAVGNLKYQVQQGLLRAMMQADSPLCLGFAECLEEARRHAG